MKLFLVEEPSMTSLNAMKSSSLPKTSDPALKPCVILELLLSEWSPFTALLLIFAHFSELYSHNFTCCHFVHLRVHPWKDVSTWVWD